MGLDHTWEASKTHIHQLPSRTHLSQSCDFRAEVTYNFDVWWCENHTSSHCERCCISDRGLLAAFKTGNNLILAACIAYWDVSNA